MTDLSLSDTYIVFGEAKIEDLSQQAQMQAADKFRNAADMMPQVMHQSFGHCPKDAPKQIPFPCRCPT